MSWKVLAGVRGCNMGAGGVAAAARAGKERCRHGFPAAWFLACRPYAIVIAMTREDRLWKRYWTIREGHGNGFWLPIIWHLALRQDPLAMIELSSWLRNPGRIADPFSQEGLAYRAFRLGNLHGAQHLALNGFNQNDLGKYRYWLARGGKAGSADAARELRRFEIRLPHANARRIGRKRPHRRSDFD